MYVVVVVVITVCIVLCSFVFGLGVCNKKLSIYLSMLRPPLRPPIGYLAVIDSDGAKVMELSSHIDNASSVLLRHFGNI